MSRPILVTGATGLLGGACLWRWREEPRGLAALVRRPGKLPHGAWPGVGVAAGDLGEPDRLGRAVAELRPALVVNCAALTGVDAAEERPGRARLLNAAGPGALAAAAREAGAEMVHISTDAVYAQGPGPHREEDAGGRLSVYAASKLEGEAAVLSAHPGALVLRTCLFGWNQNPGRSSLAEWVVQSLARGREITGFVDVSFSPLFTDTLAGWILAGVRAGLAGVYNLGSAAGASKHDFARLLARSLGLDPELVRPGSQARAGLAAPRPAAPVMDSGRFFAAVGGGPPGLEEEAARFAAWAQGGELERFRRFGGYP
jgi:dTDP-4-dehydrorhamnose reductase